MHKMLFCVLNNHLLFFVYIIYDFVILCIVNKVWGGTLNLRQHRPYAHISLVFLHPQVQLQHVLGRL